MSSIDGNGITCALPESNSAVMKQARTTDLYIEADLRHGAMELNISAILLECLTSKEIDN